MHFRTPPVPPQALCLSSNAANFWQCVATDKCARQYRARRTGHGVWRRTAAKPEERRRSLRHPFHVWQQSCSDRRRTSLLVKDYSDGGVRLQLNRFEIPDDFALLLAPNEPAQSGRYRVVWRLGRDVGTKFVGPTSFPSGHDAPP